MSSQSYIGLYLNMVIMSNYEHSAGFVVRVKDKYLACHATGKSFVKGWDIPKGHIEEGEEAFEAALRELFEETHILLHFPMDNPPVYLGKFDYIHGKKDLELFLVDLPDLNINDLKCTSMFDRDGDIIPEMDKFTLIPHEKFEGYYYPRLAQILNSLDI